MLASLAHVFTSAYFGQSELIPSLGASGAISGVLAGYMLLFLVNLLYAPYIFRFLLELPPAMYAVGYLAFALALAYVIVRLLGHLPARRRMFAKLRVPGSNLFNSPSSSYSRRYTGRTNKELELRPHQCTGWPNSSGGRSSSWQPPSTSSNLACGSAAITRAMRAASRASARHTLGAPAVMTRAWWVDCVHEAGAVSSTAGVVTDRGDAHTTACVYVCAMRNAYQCGVGDF
ncbi:hypothetical protein EON66_10905 [archaeon]|nr:MAG: hypothetical protein EON66_10905 [archaeon]